MKFIKRLSHDARKMEDAILGWDIFRCRDYSNVDGVIENLSDMRKIKSIFGYVIILAVNMPGIAINDHRVIKGHSFFKRLFIKL